MANLIPPRRNEFLTREGVPTIRFAEYLELLTGQINSNTGAVESAAPSTAASQIAALENRLGSGDALTFDEDGFTWDLDVFSFDQDEA